MTRKILLRLFLTVSFLTSCATAPLMQESYFDQVATGVRIADIEASYGEPYEIRNLHNGMQEYTYIQRIDLGSSAVEQLEFIFLVNSQGHIVSKQCQRKGTSSFCFVP